MGGLPFGTPPPTAPAWQQPAPVDPMAAALQARGIDLDPHTWGDRYIRDESGRVTGQYVGAYNQETTDPEVIAGRRYGSGRGSPRYDEWTPPQPMMRGGVRGWESKNGV